MVYSALVCSFGYALFVQAVPLYIELDLDVDTANTRQIPYRTRWDLHLSSPSVFSGVRVTRSLVLCVCVVYRCLSFCTFYFGHRLTLCCLFFFDIRILITPLVSSNSSIYKIVRRSRTLAYFNTNLN